MTLKRDPDIKISGPDRRKRDFRLERGELENTVPPRGGCRVLGANRSDYYSGQGSAPMEIARRTGVPVMRSGAIGDFGSTTTQRGGTRCGVRSRIKCVPGRFIRGAGVFLFEQPVPTRQKLYTAVDIFFKIFFLLFFLFLAFIRVVF